MSNKRSIHSKILDFFQTAPINEAELVFGLVRDQMRQRRKMVGIPTYRKPKIRERSNVTEESRPTPEV